MMLGTSEILGENFNDHYEGSELNIVFLQFVYVAYSICSTIILLNLLIAMMTDTYAHIKAMTSIGATYMDSFRLVYKWRARIFKYLKIRIHDNITRDQRRWMLTVPIEKIKDFGTNKNTLEGPCNEKKKVVNVSSLEGDSILPQVD